MLIAKKFKILAKYRDFFKVFFKKKVFVLSKFIKLNQYAIKLQDYKKLLYEFIYSLKFIKLKIEKNYIKINLANKFIWQSKLTPSVSILFVQKLDFNLQLCIDY